MKFIISFSRILVGTLFIFSGLIKANDILGFSYKLEEYWVEFGIGWDWLIALDVPMAAAICIFEIVLGVATIIGYRMELVSKLLLIMIVFFTILTFASAAFGLVKTCGCFGDAIPLTPWQSFIKDVILMIFIVILFIFRDEVYPFEKAVEAVAFVVVPTALMAWVSNIVGWEFPMFYTMVTLIVTFVLVLIIPKYYAGIIVALSLVGSTYFSIMTLTHLPAKDFRAYAVGKNLPEQMRLPEGAKPDVYENTFKYKNLTTGEVEEFNEQNYPWDDKNYEFVDRVTTLIQKGDEAKITDLSIMGQDGMDYTEDFLNDPDYILMLVSYNIEEASDAHMKEINALVDECFKNGVSVIGLSASDGNTVEDFRHKHQTMFDFYVTDAITLKTMIRSNPGLMLIKGGTVQGKWHHNDVPDFKTMMAPQ